MERTLSLNYPVLRQISQGRSKEGCIIEYLRKTPLSKDTTLYINTGSKKGLIDRIFRKESNDSGFLQTHSSLDYFALVQGSSY